METHILYKAFESAPEEFVPISEAQRGKVYVDVPHRFFADVGSLKKYVQKISNMGANVLLLLPHFLPSFSEYVVKNYEKPCSLFGDWEAFGKFMAFVEKLGMDRMIDIPFNHADWQAENLQRHWFKNSQANGIEAGADDTDADGNRVRINWGAFILENGGSELQRYWLDKVIFPHVSAHHVNAIRVDAAWGLDRNGLGRLVRETRGKFPHVWFLAENLGMDRLIHLAESGIAAGAERYFNNYYWYSGGWYVPSDNYRFFKRAQGRPTCTLYSSHDVLMPAMRALSWLWSEKLGHLNDKALHRQIVERDRITSIAQLSVEEREKVVQLMKLNFILAAFLSSDVMWVAGSEIGLLERVDVLRSGPLNFEKGVNSELPAFMTAMLRAKAADSIFNTEGVVVPFGEWGQGKLGCRGYVKKVGKRRALVAVNTNLRQEASCPVPKSLLAAPVVNEISTMGVCKGTGTALQNGVILHPGQGIILFS